MIPSKPLVIDYDRDELTLDENAVLFDDTYSINEFRNFLIEHVDHQKSWTEKEIGKIKVKELNDVRDQVFAKIREKVIPLASAPSLETGRGENPEMSQDG